MRKASVTLLWVLAVCFGIYMGSPASVLAQNAPAKKVRIGVSIPAADHGLDGRCGVVGQARHGALSRYRVVLRHGRHTRKAGG